MGVWWLSNQSLPSSYPTTNDCFDEFFSACMHVCPQPRCMRFANTIENSNSEPKTILCVLGSLQMWLQIHGRVYLLIRNNQVLWRRWNILTFRASDLCCTLFEMECISWYDRTNLDLKYILGLKFQENLNATLFSFSKQVYQGSPGTRRERVRARDGPLWGSNSEYHRKWPLTVRNATAQSAVISLIEPQKPI